MARFRWAALCVAVFACVWSFPVAADEYKKAQGVVCDTAEQIAMFGSLIDEMGPQAALAKVNEDAKDPSACAPAAFVYKTIGTGATVRASGVDWVVTEILVVAVATPQGIVRVEPKAFWALTKAEGRPA